MGRLPSEAPRKYNIQHMWALHHEICRLDLLGMKGVEIAKTLNITPATVSNCLNSPIVKQRTAVLRAARDASSLDVAKRIQELLPEALEVMEDILTNENASASVRANIAQDLLDRGGFAPPKVVETRNYTAFLTGEDIERIKQRALETGRIGGGTDVDKEREEFLSGNVIDVDVITEKEENND